VLRRFGNEMKNLDKKFTANLQELSTIEGLTDVEIGTGMKILKQMYADLDGLQGPVFGQYSPGSTIPHFTATERRFVQVFYLPEHWVCGTNVFSEQLTRCIDLTVFLKTSFRTQQSFS
jgi:hypothetical protein